MVVATGEVIDLDALEALQFSCIRRLGAYDPEDRAWVLSLVESFIEELCRSGTLWDGVLLPDGNILHETPGVSTWP